MAKSKASKAHGAPPTKKVAARQTATPTTDVLSPSLLKQACKFLNTTAGLDLTLRLFQGFVIIAAKAQDEVISTQSFIAASQLDLGQSTHSLTSPLHLNGWKSCMKKRKKLMDD